MQSNSIRKLQLRIGVKMKNASLFQLSTAVHSQRIQEDLGGTMIILFFKA